MSTSVRCKFHCYSVTKVKSQTGYHYAAEFRAVTHGSEENKRFWAYTPNGSLSVTCIRDDQFTPGCDYYLDISPCPEQQS